MELHGIEQALKGGCRLHAFRSGGGLRVVRIEEAGTLKGYGEHPHVSEALIHANDDAVAGGREYSQVYGGAKPLYLTGSSVPESGLDDWLMHGNTFDAYSEADEFVFELKGFMVKSMHSEVRVGRGPSIIDACTQAFNAKPTLLTTELT